MFNFLKFALQRVDYLLAYYQIQNYHFLKEKILHEAGELFMRYGIRSVTMDEIARQLGISKKTLYQIVENKADLIKQVMYQHQAEDLEQFLEIKNTSSNAIEEMLGLARHMMELLNKMSPTVMYDLQKYYHESWQLMEELHKKHAYAIIQNNIEEGKQQGLYRDDINADVTARFYVALSLLLVDEQLFPQKKYRKEQLVEQYISYHIHGIASPAGVALLEKHLIQTV